MDTLILRLFDDAFQFYNLKSVERTRDQLRGRSWRISRPTNPPKYLGQNSENHITMQNQSVYPTEIGNGYLATVSTKHYHYINLPRPYPREP